MILTALLISFVTLVATMALYGRFPMPTEENVSGPRSDRDASQGLLEAVADRLIALVNAREEAFRAAHNAASQLRQGIAARAHRLNAWLILRQAEAKAQSAQEAVIDQQLREAEALLDQAVDLFERACEELGDAQGNDLVIDRVRRSCRNTAVSLRAHAAFTVRKMSRLLARNERPLIPFETNASSNRSRREAA